MTRRFFIPAGYLVAVISFFVLVPCPASAGRPGNISLQVRQTAVRDVFLVLARQAGVNVLVSASVRGKVSFSLSGVSPLKAMGLVARIHGYRAAIISKVVCIGTPDELLELKRGSGLALYRLRNARSADMKKLVAGLFKRLNVVHDKRTNTLIIGAAAK